MGVIAAPSQALSITLAAAIERVTGQSEVDPLLTPARQPGFDLQANFAMKLAKQLGAAAARARRAGDARSSATPMGCSRPSRSPGPGFVNLAFSPEALAAWATRALADPRLGVPGRDAADVVVDYSAPNVAKEMHVGHLRTTVIGDALVRALEFAGPHA